MPTIGTPEEPKPWPFTRPGLLCFVMPWHEEEIDQMMRDAVRQMQRAPMIVERRGYGEARGGGWMMH